MAAARPAGVRQSAARGALRDPTAPYGCAGAKACRFRRGLSYWKHGFSERGATAGNGCPGSPTLRYR